MIPALVLAAVAAAIGWRRAARAGGGTKDRLQYAAAHAIPTFLGVMIFMTIALNMGWIAL